MFIYIDIRCRCRPCADLGRCAPSVRLGTPSELGARSSLLAALAPTRLPPRSDGGFPSPPLRDGALRRPRLGRRLAAAPPRGSAALGPASVGLGRAGEGYEHSARLARAPQAPPSESAPRALVTSRARQKYLSEALRTLLSDFHPETALPDGYAPARPSERLTAPRRPHGAAALGPPGLASRRAAHLGKVIGGAPFLHHENKWWLYGEQRHRQDVRFELRLARRSGSIHSAALRGDTPSSLAPRSRRGRGAGSAERY